MGITMTNVQDNTSAKSRPKNYWQVFCLRSPKELDEQDDYLWRDENFEEISFTPQGKVTLADYVLDEKPSGKREALFLLGLSGDHQQDNLLLSMPLRSESAQTVIEPLCFLRDTVLLGSVISLHHYLYQTESHNYPEIRFRVKLNQEFFLNAPLSSSIRWQEGYCYNRLEQLQKKLDCFTLSAGTMQDADFDW